MKPPRYTVPDAPWTDAAGPGPMWRVWDDFGIAEARMLGCLLLLRHGTSVRSVNSC